MYAPAAEWEAHATTRKTLGMLRPKKGMSVAELGEQKRGMAQTKLPTLALRRRSHRFDCSCLGDLPAADITSGLTFSLGRSGVDFKDLLQICNVRLCEIDR